MIDMCLKYADYIIELAQNDSKKLSNKMLQKILFYSYVDYAVQEAKPMFDEQFHAWKNGPVIPLIYDHYQKYQDGIMQPSKKDGILTDEKKKKIIKKVYSKLIEKNIDEIILKTHSPNNEGNKSPWAKHYTDNILDILTTNNDMIPFEEIYNFYKEKTNYKNLQF